MRMPNWDSDKVEVNQSVLVSTHVWTLENYSEANICRDQYISLETWLVFVQ